MKMEKKDLHKRREKREGNEIKRREDNGKKRKKIEIRVSRKKA
jgi:hypothetical protein